MPPSTLRGCDAAKWRLQRALGTEAGLFGVIVARWQPRGKPTSSSFYGILIRMFFNDHAPPHFHAPYGEFEATIEIATLAIVEGQLPRRALNLVQEWP